MSPYNLKRIAPIFLILALLLSGCGSGPESGASDDQTAVPESADVPGSTGAATDSEDTPNDPVAASGAGTDDAGVGTSDSPALVSGSDAPGIDVDITEKMYVAYTNEIYTNTEDYIGKMIRLQGMFQAYTDEETGLTYYFVFRVGPGCCGNDGDMCGFEFTWDGELPEDNDWIEVTGSLRTYEDNGWAYLVLDAVSVTVMDERGAENVFQ